MATLRIHGSKPHTYKKFPLQKKHPAACGGVFFIQCGCGKTGYDGGVVKHDKSAAVTCPWCGSTGEIVIAERFAVSGGGY
jgi:hypothetical protein